GSAYAGRTTTISLLFFPSFPRNAMKGIKTRETRPCLCSSDHKHPPTHVGGISIFSQLMPWLGFRIPDAYIDSQIRPSQQHKEPAHSKCNPRSNPSFADRQMPILVVKTIAFHPHPVRGGRRAGAQRHGDYPATQRRYQNHPYEVHPCASKYTEHLPYSPSL